MDREMALELGTSKLWEGVITEINTWIQADLNALKRCIPEELKIIQTRIQAYERLKELPSIVSDREE
jgi:hypothetical protein